MHLYKKKS